MIIGSSPGLGHVSVTASCSGASGPVSSWSERSWFRRVSRDVTEPRSESSETRRLTLTLLAFSRYFLYRSSICFISSSFFRKASCNSSIFKAIDEIVDHNNFKNTSTDKTVNSLTALRDCLVYSYIYNFIFKNSQSFFFNRKFFLEIKTTLWKYTNYKKHSLKAKGITKCGLCIRIVEYYSASILIHATAWRHYTKRK